MRLVACTVLHLEPAAVLFKPWIAYLPVMKKVFNLVALVALIVCLAGCSASNNTNRFTAGDAENAIREALQLGSIFAGNSLGTKGGFNPTDLLGSLIPADVQKVTKVLGTLGLSSEVNKFSSTLATASEETARNAVPLFLNGIKRMPVKNAFSILKNGGTAATDYLRSTIGDTLRRSLTPVMNNALSAYGLTNQWNKLIAPAQLLLGDKLNLDLGNFVAGLVANAMFTKMEQKERDIRQNAGARTSTLLQKAFGKFANP